MVAPKALPAVADAVADAIDRLAVAIAERGAKLEDYSGQLEGLLQGDHKSWRQAYIKLGLPSFSGARDEWLRFYRSYKETATYFSESENRRRVSESLRGAAREHARPLMKAGCTADHILISVEEHFNLFLAVAYQLLESIDQLQPLHEHSRPIEFVVFATQVDDIVSGLSSLSKRSYYVDDPRLAMKVMNRVNEHHRESWRAYSAPDLPILVKVSKFLNKQAAKVRRFSHAWVQPPPPGGRPNACFNVAELCTEARMQLERLPRLETPAPALQVVVFAAILRNVVAMVSARDKWLLTDAQVFYKALDRLNPFYAWRWYDFAAAAEGRATAEPELATLAWFMTDEAARVSKVAPAPKHHNHSKSMAKPPARPTSSGCLCCHGNHWTVRCRALLRMSSVERLRWARKNDVCVRCIDTHRGRRCRAPRCSVPHCHRPHHVMLHTNNSILS